MTHFQLYLIGAGVIARYHAAAIAKLPGAPSVTLSVADPNPAALAEFAAQFAAARLYTDSRAMLAEPPQEGDIVVVAAPPFTHHALALAALASGRHVLCEKPLAMTRAEADDMLRAARAANRLLGCCSSRFLNLPTNAEVKRLLQEDALGKLYHATFINRDRCERAGIEYQPGSRWFLDRSKNGGGILMDWGAYDFACLNDILQPLKVEVLSAWMANPAGHIAPAGVVFDVEEHGGASLRYHLRDGAQLHLTYERAACAYGQERSLVEIEGLRGAVNWDWLMLNGQGAVTLTRDGADGFERSTAAYSTDEALEPHDKPLVYFYQRVRGEDSPAVVNEQALFNFGCFRAMFDYVETGLPQVVEW
jgi:predicted dehydrogenase